jgi:hypothetical protein
MEKEFRAFLDENFGTHNTKALLDQKKLSLNKGTAKELYEGNLDQNTEQVLKLVCESHHTEIKKYDWAFDFPGWIGTLDFTKVNVKDILVIGMEPHIGDEYEKDGEIIDRTVQTTYGLRETEEYEYSELSEYLGNRMLWNNLNSIFNNNDELYTMDNYKNNLDPEFLKRIYITDMSQFAVKGLAKQANIANWRKIREDNAEKYIVRTINFIMPKYIISQGNAVANFIDRILIDNKQIEELKPTEFLVGRNTRYKNFPNFKSYELNSNKIIHIRLPHLASGLTNGFWLPNNLLERRPKMDEIRKQLENFTNQKN